MLFLVNLDAADVRRRHMTTQLELLGLAFSRVGIDMRTRCNGEITAWVEARFPNIQFDLDRLSGAEVGCWLSHLTAWQSLVDKPAPACTVIEDDIILRAGFAEAIQSLGGQDLFDFVFLGTSSRNLSTRRRTRIDRLWAHAPVGAIYNTWGYSIRRTYAERFFAESPHRIEMPIDHFIGGSSHSLKPRIAVLRPAVVEEDRVLGADSQIEPHTNRIDRWHLLEMARRRLLSSRVTQLYYSLYRLL